MYDGGKSENSNATGLRIESLNTLQK
jgi:hypothetical protein